VFTVQEKKADRSGHPRFHRDNRECGQPSFSLLVAGAGVGIDPRPEQGTVLAFTWGPDGILAA